jgi:YegS/Rv2252/BmrU family lipid kinase
LKPVPHNSKTAFVVLNPVAGIVNPALLRRNIENRFYAQGWQTRFHITEKDENLAAIVRQEIETGADLIVAAGGDGTIAAVAAGMIHSPVPLGIIPTGTWNAIARNLMLPYNLTRAVNLMTGRHNLKRLDLMAIGNTIHAMNMGIGFSSLMVAHTGRGDKRKFGNLAYFSNAIKQVFGLQQRRYTIEADGKRYRGRAAEIFVANYGVIGLNIIESSLDIKPDDGKVDVLIMRARTVFDLPSLFWQMFIQRKKRSPKYRQLSAMGSLVIRTSPPSPVQADGELLGETPITVKVLPRCVKVIVPLERQPVIPGQLLTRR